MWRIRWRKIAIVTLTLLSLLNLSRLAVSAFNHHYDYRAQLVKDFANPACEPYWTLPIGQLKKPCYAKYGGNCFHLYTSRSTQGSDPLPFTLALEDRKDSAFYGGKLRSQYLVAYFTSLNFSSLVCLSWFFLTIARKRAKNSRED